MTEVRYTGKVVGIKSPVPMPDSMTSDGADYTRLKIIIPNTPESESLFEVYVDKGVDIEKDSLVTLEGNLSLGRLDEFTHIETDTGPKPKRIPVHNYELP